MELNNICIALAMERSCPQSCPQPSTAGQRATPRPERAPRVHPVRPRTRWASLEIDPSSLPWLFQIRTISRAFFLRHLDQVHDVFSPSRAIDATTALMAPSHECFDVYHDFANRTTLRLDFANRGQCVPLPVLESVVELATVAHNLNKTLRLFARVPPHTDLRVGRNCRLRYGVFHRRDFSSSRVNAQ